MPGISMLPGPKEADATLKLDTELLIVDKLVYDATKRTLQCVAEEHSRKTRGLESSDESAPIHGGAVGELPNDLLNLVRMVDSSRQCFNITFPSPYNADEADEDEDARGEDELDALRRILRFRLALLRFTVLFATRLLNSPLSPTTSSVEGLRVKNRTRAESWQWHANVNQEVETYPEDVLEWYADLQDGTSQGSSHASGLSNGTSVLPPASVAGHTGFSSVPSYQRPRAIIQSSDNAHAAAPATLLLLDLIPYFVKLTHDRAAPDPDWHTTEAWQRLAAEMMLQAVLEQFLDPGEKNEARILEAFAWGLEGIKRHESPDEDVELDDAVNFVFCLPDEATMSISTGRDPPTWNRLRQQYLELLVPHMVRGDVHGHQASQDERWKITKDHVQSLRRTYPIENFERQTIGFLEGMCESYERPLLAQLEEDGSPISIDGMELDEWEEGILRELLVGGG